MNMIHNPRLLGNSGYRTGIPGNLYHSWAVYAHSSYILQLHYKMTGGVVIIPEAPDLEVGLFVE